MMISRSDELGLKWLLKLVAVEARLLPHKSVIGCIRLFKSSQCLAIQASGQQTSFQQQPVVTLTQNDISEENLRRAEEARQKQIEAIQRAKEEAARLQAEARWVSENLHILLQLSF